MSQSSNQILPNARANLLQIKSLDLFVNNLSYQKKIEYESKCWSARENLKREGQDRGSEIHHQKFL
jgi:hypothetical protein